MEKTLYLAIIFVGILSCGTLNAQSVADSVTVAKSEKEVLKLSMKLTEDKKELEKARKEYAVEYEDAKKRPAMLIKPATISKAQQISVKMKEEQDQQQEK